MNKNKKKDHTKQAELNARADKALIFSIKLARKIGQYLKNQQAKMLNQKLKMVIENKKSQGVASQVDLAAEAMIVAAIIKKFPLDHILAEESAYEKFKGESSKYRQFQKQEFTWVIDPLDGTNNFLNGLDYFAVCISLLYRGLPIVGVVYRPVTDEIFYAKKNGGSFYQKNNGRVFKIGMVENVKKSRESLFVTGFTSEKGKIFEGEFLQFKKMMGKSRGIRRMGSAALDLCYLAQGTFDCFWERGLAPWDMAASMIICEESHVLVTDYNGRDFHPFKSTILAARKPLYHEVLSYFK